MLNLHRRWVRPRRSLVRRLVRGQIRGQAMVEVVVVTLVVGLGIAWVTYALPQAVSSHFQESQRVLASPL